MSLQEYHQLLDLIIVSFDNISHSHSSNSDFKLLLGDIFRNNRDIVRCYLYRNKDEGGTNFSNEDFLLWTGNTNLIYGLIVISCLDASLINCTISAQHWYNSRIYKSFSWCKNFIRNLFTFIRLQILLMAELWYKMRYNTFNCINRS